MLLKGRTVRRARRFEKRTSRSVGSWRSGGFANAVVGADLFRRLVARDGAFADDAVVRGDEQQSSSRVFSEAAWTGFAILGAGFCLRVVNGARERVT